MKNKFLKNEKGFSFTFDAMLAVIIIVGIFVLVSASNANTTEYSSQKIVQKQLADDLLKASIDLNKLQSFDQGRIEGFFFANVPGNYDYQLLIENYNLLDKFVLSSAILYGNQSADLNLLNYTETKKIFLTLYNNDVNKYSLAKLRVWVR